jgi:hypothetical protein
MTEAADLPIVASFLYSTKEEDGRVQCDERTGEQLISGLMGLRIRWRVKG